MARKLETYTVSVDFMSGISFDVEAANEEEAIEKAHLLAESAVEADEFERGSFNFDITGVE